MDVGFDDVAVVVVVAAGPIPICAITPNSLPVVGYFGFHSQVDLAVAGHCHRLLWQQQVLPPMLRQGYQPQQLPGRRGPNLDAAVAVVAAATGVAAVSTMVDLLHHYFHAPLLVDNGAAA